MAQINKPSEYFNTVLYTGNGTLATPITGVGFQPDLTWIKNRTGEEHLWYDAVRGADKLLRSNNTAGDATTSTTVYFNSFDSDGFTIGTETAMNASGQNIVAWNWLGANTTVSNTAGSITSTVSANTTSGFSVVSYTGTGAVPVTVGHGLGVVPEVLIIKNRTNAYDWVVYHKDLGNTGGLFLNTTSAFTTDADLFNNTSPTSSVVTFSNSTKTNQGSANHIMYAFNSVKGFSKFGSYTGNGNADGPFVYTGFKPAFVMIKNASAGSTDWYLYDNKRGGPASGVYGNNNKFFLKPNSTAAEANESFDMYSNGFKIKISNSFLNGSGNTLIYMAFAENPLVGTNNIPATAR
jgi:hypothetical protein